MEPVNLQAQASVIIIKFSFDLARVSNPILIQTTKQETRSNGKGERKPLTHPLNNEMVLNEIEPFVEWVGAMFLLFNSVIKFD